MRYLVMIRRAQTGYSVDVPDLPGCVAAAKSLKSARRLIADAVALHLDLMSKAGETIPAPRQSIDFAIDPDAIEELCTWVDVDIPEPAAQPVR
jgi:predicted RNase H-like HicB family nuclease